MALVLSEEEQLLKETARSFLAEKSPVAELRKLRDASDAVGFSRPLWREMVELGWAGIPFAEEFGGAGLGWSELGLVMQECGRTLAPTPLLASVALGGGAIALAGSEGQRKDLLTPLCAGESLLALAGQEGPRHAPFAVRTRAEASGDGYRLSGEKHFVLDGQVADTIVVPARTSGAPGDRDGIGLFLVSRNSAGLHATRTWTMDGRGSAHLRLDDVEVGSGALLGDPGEGGPALEAVLDRATAVLCAEMLGSIEEAFDRTLAYLKVREQFGAPIGSFQALKHRAARLYIEVELCRTAVLEALQAADAGGEDLALLASGAKAQLSHTAVRMGNESVQMHGGIGVTDEEDIGLFMKRLRVSEQTLGAAGYHRDRYATLRGY